VIVLQNCKSEDHIQATSTCCQFRQVEFLFIVYIFLLLCESAQYTLYPLRNQEIPDLCPGISVLGAFSISPNIFYT
jgi:hypothetical protein